MKQITQIFLEGKSPTLVLAVKGMTIAFFWNSL